MRRRFSAVFILITFNISKNLTKVNVKGIFTANLTLIKKCFEGIDEFTSTPDFG